MEKDQGSMGTTSLVPFSLNQIIGYINPFLAMKTDLTEADISLFLDAMWKSINICTSRSKIGQTSRLLLRINLVDPMAKIADLHNKIRINEAESFDLRSLSDITWDFSGLVTLIELKMHWPISFTIKPAPWPRNL
jgi:CRISPR-associated protein Csh2